MSDEIFYEIYIQNIPYSTTQNELSDWCSSFGPVTKCVILRDPLGNSRGFAFVTFSTFEGYNRILSEGPHRCQNRLLVVRPAKESSNSNADQLNTTSDQTMFPNEDTPSTAMETSFMYDDDQHNRLATLRDEFDANIECMQIAHDREVKILREKLAREKKLRDEAEISYKEAEEDWRKVCEENMRTRESLTKNVMQTFNIRRNYARQIKQQLQKCAQNE